MKICRLHAVRRIFNGKSDRYIMELFTMEFKFTLCELCKRFFCYWLYLSLNLPISLSLRLTRYCYKFVRMVYHALFVVRCNLLQDTLNRKPSYDTVFFMPFTSSAHRRLLQRKKLLPTANAKNLENLFSIVTYVPQVAKSSPMHTKYFRNHILPIPYLLRSGYRCKSHADFFYSISSCDALSVSQT